MLGWCDGERKLIRVWMHCDWWKKVGGQAFFADLGLRQSVFLLMRLQTRGSAFYIPLNCGLLTEAP